MNLPPPLLDELTYLAARRQQSRDSLVFGTTMMRKDGERERLRALVEGSLSLADLDRERSKRAPRGQ